MHVQKQISKILVQIFCFVAIILLGSNVSTPLFSFHFMSLLSQILVSRISLIVLSVCIKVKIVHYLYFQLKRGQQEGKENTLIGSTLTVNLRATVEPKAHQFYLHVAYPLNTSFHFVTFLLLFYTSLPFTITLKFSQFCQKVMLLKTVGI